MKILALETCTAVGSIVLAEDQAVIGLQQGDPSRTHGERLPLDIVRLLSEHGLSLSDIDVFSVASGPGSFTSLRVGIATMQGLAMAQNKPLVPVSTFDAVARGARNEIENVDVVSVWMDGQRGEIFLALYELVRQREVLIKPPTSGIPSELLVDLKQFVGSRSVCIAGDAVSSSRMLFEECLTGKVRLLNDVGPLAVLVAELAEERIGTAETFRPHGIRPLYVRRPDAELARDRRRRLTK